MSSKDDDKLVDGAFDAVAKAIAYELPEKDAEKSLAMLTIFRRLVNDIRTIALNSQSAMKDL